ncbi:carboxypeptidase-like regulatory domain-containing protein [Aeoliella sp.]|uniref:carboxypeptidase-like regulatory domain-containing protein n=1 Tax=Aeoliella sp. TaxID=2795800 RepID=UPI003CCC1474
MNTAKQQRVIAGRSVKAGSLLAVVSLFGAALLAAPGCSLSSEATYPVTGVVTVRGAAVPNAMITFVPSEGRSTRVTAQSDGQYTAMLPAGSYRIAVDASLDSTYSDTSVAPDQTSMTPAQAQGVAVPEKYQQHESSGLEYEVVEQQNNTFDITL